MNIQYRQNQPEALNRLAAQRVLYRRAKITHIVGAGAVIAVALLGFVAAVLDSAAFSRFVPLIAVSLWLVDQHIIRRRTAALTQEAAEIQEDFDCHVLQLSWPKHKSVRRPTEDRVRQLAVQAERKESIVGNLRDWYTGSDACEDPLLSTVHCQRLNSWWDCTLRSEWNGVLKVLLWTLVVTAACVAVWLDVTFVSLVAMAASNIRVVAWILAEIDNQERAIRRARAIHAFLSTFSADVRPARCDVERVQDEILELRRSSPIVPDRFYRWKREAQQAEALGVETR